MQPPAAWPQLDVRAERGAVVVALFGEHDVGVADELRDAVLDPLAARRAVVVDLTVAEFVDSAVIALLVAAAHHARTFSTGFAVVCPDRPSAVRRILEVTGVQTIVGVVPTLAEALARVEEPDGDGWPAG